MNNLELIALEGIPLVEPGVDIADIIFSSLEEHKFKLKDGDVFVIAQKIISKSENRYAYLNQINPTSEALHLSKETNKDPKLVQLILNESTKVVRNRKGVIVVEHKLGFVHANAGIDKSNIKSEKENPRVLLLPKDPDLSALKIKEKIMKRTNFKIGIIINDSSGRAWRNGIVGIAIGSSGVDVLLDLRGHKDLYGNSLEVTEVGKADEIASAASLLMGQANEAFPVVLVRGLAVSDDKRDAKALLRDPSEDLFR